MVNPTTPDAWMGELFQRMSEFMEANSNQSTDKHECDCCTDNKSQPDAYECNGEFGKGGTIVDDYFIPIPEVQAVEVSLKYDSNGLVDSTIDYPPHTDTVCDCADGTSRMVTRNQWDAIVASLWGVTPSECNGEESMTDENLAALTDDQMDAILTTGVHKPDTDGCKATSGKEGRDYKMDKNGWITFITPSTDGGIKSDEPAINTSHDEMLEEVHALAMEIADEVMSAISIHGPLHSPHEGISVIREEVEELWEHVRADTGRGDDARAEAIQIGAMAMKYALNLCRWPTDD